MAKKTTRHTVTIMQADIIKWLARKEGLDAKSRVSITIEVPSGGDYSGRTLGLDEVGGLTVSWEEEIREVE